MSIEERCDKVVGSGETVLTAGRYKTGEGDEAETRYNFGLKVDVPAKETMPEELQNQIFNLGLHRQMSVAAAGIFNQANDYGTEADAQAFVDQFSTVEGWIKSFEKTRREGAAKPDTLETLARRILAKVLRDKGEDIIGREDMPEAPLTKAGAVNYPAWAKLLAEEDHPWWAVAKKKAGASEKGFD